MSHYSGPFFFIFKHALPQIAFLEVIASTMYFLQESCLQSKRLKSPSDSKNKLEVTRSHTIPSSNLDCEVPAEGKLSNAASNTFAPTKFSKTVPFKSPLQCKSTDKNFLGKLFPCII